MTAPTANPGPITILQLNTRISNAIAQTPGLQNIWVTGETSDMRISGGHLYLELVQKDENGNNIAKIRANCWANIHAKITADFAAQTGTQLAAGMQILARVTANYHPAYGISVTITAIDPTYTVGMAVRRRNQILQRLKDEGLLEKNRALKPATAPQRIAVISAQNAAGYGDFTNQLHNNPYGIKYTVTLFQATMQGEKTEQSVLDALALINTRHKDFDTVVIIRGGGATTDLSAFDSYPLGAAIANCPLPVIVGIGHERDTTVPDYVANMRVKTPTAAAEWLVARAKRLLDALDNATHIIANTVNARLLGNRRQLDIIATAIPADTRTRLTAADAQLAQLQTALKNSTNTTIALQKNKIQNLAQLIDILSPQATLRRGYSITYGPDNKILKNTHNIKPGDCLTTILADGTLTSAATDCNT